MNRIIYLPSAVFVEFCGFT